MPRAARKPWRRVERSGGEKMRFHVMIAVLLWGAASVSARRLRGISLAYRKFYREKRAFVCLDASKVVPFEHVNDDYCDCPDGSDEPGTAACPNGRFYCGNVGFRPHYIPSSRVNDGICDCCDASDEYNSRTRCGDTCRSLGQRERVALEEQMRALSDGLRLKRQLIEEGVSMWHEKKKQLEELEKISEGLQTKLEAHRKRKMEANAQKERAVGADGARKTSAALTSDESAALVFRQLDTDNDHRVTADEVLANLVRVRREERLASSEAVALLGGAAAADLPTFQRTLWRNLQGGDTVKIKDKLWGDADQTDDDLAVRAAVSAADDAEADLKEVEDAYKTVRQEIRELEELLSEDYGSSKEFMYLNGQCFELKVYEFLYSLCPFRRVSQRSSEGTLLSLGKWKSWEGPEGHLYSRMMFDEGDPCWQGPARSAVVTLVCGTQTALQSVKEPSKCRYVMRLESPAACEETPRRGGVHSEL